MAAAEPTTARSFYNPYVSRQRGRHPAGSAREHQTPAARHSYVSAMSEFKFIAPECLDEDGGGAERKGTHVGTLARAPLAYRDGETYEFLDYAAGAALWPRRCGAWAGRSCRPVDSDPRFQRFHVYDMVETTESAAEAVERDGERFLELLRPVGTVVTMLGVSEDGRRVAVHVYGVRPYFYMEKARVDAACGARSPRDVAERMAAAVRSCALAAGGWGRGEGADGGGGGERRPPFRQSGGHGARQASADCFEVDVVTRADVYYYDTAPAQFYRVRARSARFVAAVCDNFCPAVPKYEGSVDATTRLILDNEGFVSFGWYALKVGAGGARVQIRRPEHHSTSCEVEVNCTVDNLEGDPARDSWPEYKLMCFDIECKSSGRNETAFPEATNEEDLVIQVSCLLYSLPARRLEHALLFSLGSCDLPAGCAEALRREHGVDPVTLEFDSELELLLAFVTFVKQYGPEFATGYNIVNFDWTFIFNKLTVVYGLRLDGYGALNRGGTFRIWDAGASRFQKRSKVKINGLVTLDMYAVAAEKAKLPNYKLNTVAEAVLGERKKDLSYKEIPGHFAAGPAERGVIGEYCLQDSLLVGKLFFRYLPHLELSAVAKLAGILLPRAVFDGQQLRVFTCLLRLAGARGFVLPDNRRRFLDGPADAAPSPAGPPTPGPEGDEAEGGDEEEDGEEGEEDEEDGGNGADAAALAKTAPAATAPAKSASGRAVGYQGAKVLEPDSGFHVDPVVVFDFASLYPSIIQAHNLCFTTLARGSEGVADLREGDDYARFVVNGRPLYFVKRHVRESLLAALLTDWLAMRKAIRARIPGSPEDQAVLLDKQQAAIKVVCNSVYGFCGVANGLLPCLSVAATVTTVGRSMLLAVRDYIHERWATREAVEREFPALAEYAAPGGAPYSARVIYGDTDSVFVKITGVAAEGLVAAGDAMGKRVSGELFAPPIKLECEKTFVKLLLITKKKYMGVIYGGKMMMKGVDLVRKNNCRYVNSYAKRLVDLLFRDEAVAAAAAEITASPASAWLERPLPAGMKPFGDVLVEAYDRVSGRGAAARLDVGDFVMSAELSRPPAAYVNKRIAHLTVYYKLAMRAEEPPAVKDRISYVIVAESEAVARDAARVAALRGDPPRKDDPPPQPPADSPDAPADASPPSSPPRAGAKRRGGEAARPPPPAKRTRKLLVSEMAEDPTYVAETGAPLNIDYYFSHLLGTLSVTFKALFDNDTKITESVLKRFIPERYDADEEDAEGARRLRASGVFAEARAGAGLSLSEEEETRRTLRTALRTLAAAPRLC